MAISDDEIRKTLFGSNPQTANQSTQLSQPETGISDDEVRQSLFSQPLDSSDETSTFDVPSSSSSPLSLGDRLKLSFADDVGRERFLRQKFQYVERLGNGKFAAGNDPRTLQPIDPEGLFNDVLGDLADVAGEIPVIASSVIGAGLGAPAGPLGAMTGAGAGAAVGQGAKQAVGKMLGVNKQTQEEMATDLATSALFGFGGEAAGLGLKAAGAMVAPKVMRVLNNHVAGSGGAQSKTAQLISRILHFSSGVPEDKTMKVFEYGPDVVFAKGSGSKQALNSIVDDFSTLVDQKEKFIGKHVGIERGILRNSVKKPIETFDIQEKLLESTEELGITRAGIFDPNDVSGLRGDFEKVFKRLGSEVDKNGKVILQRVKKPVNDMFIASDQLDLLTNYSKDDKITGLLKTLNYGSPNFKGINVRINELAKGMGNFNYLRANQMFSELQAIKSEMKQYGIDPRNKLTIENLVNRSTDSAGTVEKVMNKFDNFMKTDFKKRMDIWDTAQAFKNTNPNLLRMGAVASLSGIGVVASDSPEGKAASLGTGLLFGTPYGAKLALQAGGKLARLYSSSAAQAAKRLPSKQVTSRAASQTLSRLLANQERKERSSR